MNANERKLSKTPVIKPAADWRFITTYSRPQSVEIGRPNIKAAGDNWGRLAQALEKFAPTVADHFNKKGIKEAEEEGKAGQVFFETKLARDAQRLQWGEIVRLNPELEGMSPYFRMGTRSAYLNARASEYKSFIVDAWNQDDIKNSDDPAAVHAWMSTKRQEWIKDKLGDQFDDVELFEGFLPGMTEAEKSVENMHSNFRLEEVSRLRREHEADAIIQHVSSNFSTRDWNDPAMIPKKQQEFGAYLMQRKQQMYADGMAGSEINKFLTDITVHLAKHYNDSDILDALDHVITDEKSGSTLGGTAYAREMKEKVSLEIHERERRKVREDREDRIWAEKQANDAMWYTASGKLMESWDKPGFDINDFLVEIKKAHPRASASLFGDFHTLYNRMKDNKRSVAEDSLFMPNLVYDISQGDVTSAELPAVLMSAVARGDLRPEQYLPALQTLQNVALANDGRSESLAKELGNDLKSLLAPTADSNSFDVNGKPILTPQDEARIYAAQRRLYSEILYYAKEWTEQGKDPKSAEFKQFISKEVVSRIAADPRFATPSTAETNTDEFFKKPQPESQPLTFPTVGVLLGTPRDKLNPEQVVLFGNPEKLDIAVRGWENATDPASSEIGLAAAHLGIDPVTFVKQQAALYGAVYLTNEEAAQKRQEAYERARQEKIAQQKQAQANEQLASARKGIEVARRHPTEILDNLDLYGDRPDLVQVAMVAAAAKGLAMTQEDINSAVDETERIIDSLTGNEKAALAASLQGMLDQVKSPNDLKAMLERIRSIFKSNDNN